MRSLLYFVWKIIDGAALYFAAMICGALLQIALEPFTVGMEEALPYIASAVAIGVLLVVVLFKRAWRATKEWALPRGKRVS